MQLILLGLLIKLAQATVVDLSNLITQIKQESPNLVVPLVPVFTPLNANYALFPLANLFDLTRSQAFMAEMLLNFQLNQLQMVGFMHYKGVDYAFLKTPYATIKVKVGDKVQAGRVVNISNSAIDINEFQLQSGKIYTNKIRLQLASPRTIKFNKAKLNASAS